MIRVVCYITILVFLQVSAIAQPKNDDCQSAITLSDVTGWCSSPRQYSNNYATASGFDRALCFFGSGDIDNDVWFKFRAIGNTVNISVIGAIAKNPKGSLQFPQIVLYRGSCSGMMTEVGCFSDAQGYNIAEMFASLTIGETYYLRVDGKFDRTGSFQLCVNNYNAVPSPSGDCSSAVVLCEPQAFTVPKVVGYGKYRDNLGNTCLRGGESSSVWYKWTCNNPGSLTFNLKPINPSDDIDFALFLLPNGLEDCSLKIPVRCMASGEQGGRPIQEWIQCTGATGLRVNSSDYQEYEGCDWTDDNFLAPVQMQKGQSYALLINNFHNTGNGFSIEFGGTATFEGPQPYFKVSKLKLGVDSLLTIWNVSEYAGKIVKYEWDFGVDASPKTHRGWKPPKVKYSSPGKKSISLTVETDNGCVVTKVRDLNIITIPPPPPPPKPKEEPTVVETSKEEKENDLKSDIDNSIETDYEANTGQEIIKSQPKKKPNFSVPKNKPRVDTSVVYYDVLHVYKLYYEADSFNIKSDHLPFIDEAITWLDKSPENVLHVEGHTNSIPRDEYCNMLAEKRSQTVLNYLRTKGIKEEKLKVKVFGRNKPQANNKSLKGRKRNQRVEIKVLKPEE
jgi:outer membrane protein OmpA-like peptidoglycan-associated protein